MTTNRPLILITNDDGIESPGLQAAAQAVADLGDLLIVAPSIQQTGASRSYPKWDDKIVHPAMVLLNGKEHAAYTAAISPAQAVVLALLDLADRPIDLCVSGINYGENVGSGVTISGTVGAAIEAACYGIPALAVSFETPHEYHMKHGDVDFSIAAHFTRQFAQKVLQTGLPPRVDILKIDVPASASTETPWKMGRVSRQRYYESLPSQAGTNGEQPHNFSYQVNVNRATLDLESDVHIFSIDKQVAVVPMTIDMTAPVSLSNTAQFLNGTSPTEK